jgi:copper chaperone CopZ
MKALRVLLVVVLSIIGYGAGAQFQAVFIGVNGLTCSQCSRTVEMGLRGLDFVSDVQMNLEHTEGKIILKAGRKADMSRIAQAVTDAGFSLRYLQADMFISSTDGAIGNSCFTYNGDQYVFIETPRQQLSGSVHLKFIGKRFLPKNEFKKMEPLMVNKCGSAAKGKTYFVAI